MEAVPYKFLGEHQLRLISLGRLYSGSGSRLDCDFLNHRMAIGRRTVGRSSRRAGPSPIEPKSWFNQKVLSSEATPDFHRNETPKAFYPIVEIQIACDGLDGSERCGRYLIRCECGL